MAVPPLRLLGYQPSRPNLRLVRLPELEVEPSPVAVNDSVALDHAIRREGWIAIKSEQVWGVPIPLEGKAFRVGPSFDFLPSRAGQAIWMLNGRTPGDQPNVYVEYDGVKREIIDRLELPAGVRLRRETSAGLIAADNRGWYLWQRGAGRGEQIDEREAAAPGTLFLSGRDGGEAEVVDTAGQIKPVELPIAGKPGYGSSASPDGRYRAVDLDISGPHEPISFTDIIQGRAKYTPRPHRLVLIDVNDGSLRVAEGVFDNFATNPVWSHDSRWLVFYAPFMRNRLWACNVIDAQLVSISFGRRSPPGPLVNVTDLFAD